MKLQFILRGCTRGIAKEWQVCPPCVIGVRKGTDNTSMAWEAGVEAEG